MIHLESKQMTALFHELTQFIQTQIHLGTKQHSSEMH